MTMQPAEGRECRALRNVAVPMQDGVRLTTSVYLPLAEGRYPTVLVRTAYNRVGFYDPFYPTHGMALVVQDCRGRYASRGDFYPFIHEAQDGRDTLEWVAAQPWSDGTVGMFGDSYLAATQLLLAPHGAPYLRALNPRFMAVDHWKRAYYCDGAFSLGLTWSWLCFECPGPTSEAAMMPLLDVAALLRRLPLLTLDEAAGGVSQTYRDYVSNNEYGEHWARVDVSEHYDRFTAPVLLTAGWYDYYPAEAVRCFLALRERAPSRELAESHRLIIGPWSHGINPTTVLGEVDFGPQALAENDATARWLDCMLHGGRAAAFQAAPIRLFTMGANEWRDYHDWPPPGVRYVPLYLRAGGALHPAPPGQEAPDHYAYDPANPVPTLGGNHSIGPYNPGLYELAKPGPYDQRPVEARPDVLTYTSEPLEQDTEVTGPVVVKLFAATSAPDTDFVARLTDVYPDGRSLNITEGVIRARFRENVWGAPRLVEPGRVYEYTIDLQVTSNLFRRGHRIRLQITSSNFPLWDRNLNTGHDPATDVEMQVAKQTIYHDSARPSHVVLPLVGPSPH